MFSPDLENYLKQTLVPIRLAVQSDTGWPVVLSLWYIYHQDHIYCATQESARVTGWLRKDARCAFEIASDRPPYCGLRGQARASLEPQHGEQILRLLLQRYLGGVDNPLARDLLQRSRREVAIRLDPINHFTWNYRERMKESPGADINKSCPE